MAVAKAIVDGRLIPFLGAGVNLCGRPPGTSMKRGQFLPSGGELSKYLASRFGYPASDSAELLRVSQFIASTSGPGPLYEELHRLLDADYPPTIAHQFFASLPSLLVRKGFPRRPLLIITTNYDDAMERALAEQKEPYDLISYVTDGQDRGKFRHYLPNGDCRLIERPNEYRGEYNSAPDLPATTLDKRTVVFKVHGAIDRRDAERDSYVITENDYIEYLTRTELSSLIPVVLMARLKRSNFLFLGYSLRDWNLRVILHRIWGNQRLKYHSWAVQRGADPLEQSFWNERGVSILDIPLDRYIEELSRRLQSMSGDAS